MGRPGRAGRAAAVVGFGPVLGSFRDLSFDSFGTWWIAFSSAKTSLGAFAGSADGLGRSFTTLRRSSAASTTVGNAALAAIGADLAGNAADAAAAAGADLAGATARSPLAARIWRAIPRKSPLQASTRPAPRQSSLPASTLLASRWTAALAPTCQATRRWSAR